MRIGDIKEEYPQSSALKKEMKFFKNDASRPGNSSPEAEHSGFRPQMEKKGNAAINSVPINKMNCSRIGRIYQEGRAPGWKDFSSS